MNLCHVSWMICDGDVLCLGSLLCSWYAGSISVVARVDMVVFSLGWGQGLSPLCSVACTVDALRI